MRANVFILICMIFFHIIDDFYLQGWLAKAKQKSWWVYNAPDKIYKNDYWVALFMHSFSWTFMITLVPVLLTAYWRNYWYPYLFVLNMIIHLIVDDAKANRHLINLIQDQCIHLTQITISWIIIMIL